MEEHDIFLSYLRVTQHMSQQFRTHFGRLNLTFPQALVLTVLGEDGPVPISTLASVPAAQTARSRASWTGWRNWALPSGSAARPTGG